MKQYLRIYMVLLLALVAGAGTSFGQRDTITLNFEGTGTFPFDKNWTANNFSSYKQNYHTGSQCAQTNTTATLTYNNKIEDIQSVELWVSKVSKNANSSPISIEYSADNKTWETLAKIDFTTGSAITGKYVWAKLEATKINKTGYIRINKTRSNTTATRLIDDIVITYAKSTKTETTTSFGETIDNKTVTVNEGEEGNFTPPTATLSPAEAGTLTYSSSNTDVATVDDKGNITFGTAFGETTITALFAGNDTYAKSSASYTLDHKKYVTEVSHPSVIRE